MSRTDPAEDLKKSGGIGIAFVAAIVAIVVAIASNFFGGEESSQKSQITVDKDSEQGKLSDESSSVGGIDSDASLAVFEKEIVTLNQQISELSKLIEQSNSTNEKKLREAKTALSRQIQQVVEEADRANRKRIDDVYTKVITSDDENSAIDFDLAIEDIEGIDQSELGDTGELDKSAKRTKKRKPFGDDYIVLGSVTHRVSAENTEVVIEEPPEGLFDDIKDQYDSAQDLAKGRQNNPRRDESKQHKQVSFDFAQEPVAREIETIEVPPTSFVKVTTLYGVNCPIGGQLVGTESNIPSRPIVLPIRGVFHGPMGTTVDLGTAHLYGTCSARRTGDADIGRAEIKVNKISYWDQEGGSQWANASGPIIDERDNELDVAGYIDNVKGAHIAKESFAAAMMAYTATLSSKEFTQVVSDAGNPQSVLNGDDVRAASASGVSNLFQRYAERWEQQANAAVDTVRVPAGVPLRFVSDMKIAVQKAADPVEVAFDQYYDILI